MTNRKTKKNLPVISKGDPLPNVADDEAPSVPVEEAKPSNVIPFAPREITGEVFIRNKGAFGKAFMVTERMEMKARTVKRTRVAWQKRYDAWIKAPRG